MLSNIVSALLDIAQNLGYGGIVFLMAVESSFFPFPSEIIIPPYAYLAQKGQFNIFLVILSGALGSLIGAFFNYYAALFIGRPIICKIIERPFIKYIFFSRPKLEKAENFFLKNSSLATFTGRLIPAVRQLISIPAGFFRMDLKKFAFYTSAGSFIWVGILAALGYFFGYSQELIEAYYKELSIATILILTVIFIGRYYYKKYRS